MIYVFQAPSIQFFWLCKILPFYQRQAFFLPYPGPQKYVACSPNFLQNALGIQAKVCQLTRITSRVDLTRINLPPLDNYLLHQRFILCSILRIQANVFWLTGIAFRVDLTRINLPPLYNCCTKGILSSIFDNNHF